VVQGGEQCLRYEVDFACDIVCGLDGVRNAFGNVYVAAGTRDIASSALLASIHPLLTSLIASCRLPPY